MVTKAFPYQLEDVERMEQLGGRVLNTNSMGTGKSLETLLFAHRNPHIRPVIIVCPASLRWNWQNECIHHYNIMAEVLEGMNPKKHHIDKKRRFFIINYDILRGWMEFLKSIDPQLIILDESGSFLGSTKTIRTRQVRKLCKNVPHVLALSGTPFTSRPAQLWPTLNILAPHKFPSFFPFGLTFCDGKKTPYGWTFTGATKLKELHRLLKPIMIRRKKEDVLKDLPPKSRHIVLVDIEQREEYDREKAQFIKWLRINASKDGDMFSKLRIERDAKMGSLKRMAGELKLPSTIEWIQSFLEGTNDKLIVYGIHRAVLGTVRKAFPRIHAFVDGSVTGRDRHKEFTKFVKDKRTRLFIGNIIAAGTGWNATGCSNVVFIEYDWNPANHIQGEDRTSGINRGVKGIPSTAYYLTAKGTLEESIAGRIQEKQKNLDTVLDNGKVIQTLNVFDLLTKQLLEESGK